MTSSAPTRIDLAGGTIDIWPLYLFHDGAQTVNAAISLRAHADNSYVSADNAGANPLIANRTAIGTWETFNLIHNGDGSISLRALANNQIVTAENAGAAPLIANRTAIGPWEEFDLILD